MPIKPPPDGLQPLKAFRVKRKLTQLELVTLTGFRQENISRWETGSMIPTKMHLRGLCRVLKAEPQDLFTGFILKEIERRAALKVKA